MQINLESFNPTCAAVLLREVPDPAARHRFTALASGLFTIVNATPEIEVDGKLYASIDEGPKIFRGCFYARTILVHDGKTFPAPREGDYLALTIGVNAISAFKVLTAGANGGPGGALALDEVVVDARPDIDLVTDMWVNVANAASLRNQHDEVAT